MRVFLFNTLFILIGISACAQSETEMSFEEYNPPSTLVVPENPVIRAKFPFIDIHSHHWRMAQQDLGKLAGEMDEMNMGIIVNLSGGGGKRLKDITDHVSASKHANRIAVFTNLNYQSIDDPDFIEASLQQLEYDVANGAKGLKVFKSLGLTNKDKAGKRIAINDKRLDPIWAKCGELGIPILIHSGDPKPFWQPHDANNERWLELKTRPRRKRGADNPVPWETIIAEQHDIFRRHKGTTFIAAHFGWYANDLARLSEILDEMPNVYIECGAIIAELGRQPRNANAFLTKYQDRILFGKDSYKPEEYPTYFRVLETEDEYFPYYKKYHAFWSMYGLGLEDEVLKKMYYKNALKIVPGLDKSLFPE